MHWCSKKVWNNHNAIHGWLDVISNFEQPKYFKLWINTSCENAYQIEIFPNRKNQQIHKPITSPFHEGNNLVMSLGYNVADLKLRGSHWENHHYLVLSL
jgi:hypothetical protein